MHTLIWLSTTNGETEINGEKSFVTLAPCNVAHRDHGFDPDGQVLLVQVEDVVERDGDLVTGRLVEEGR